MGLYDHSSMADLSAEQQALKAIRYLLQRVKDDDRLYYLIGEGSESFNLLTEAYSTLTGADLVEVRKSLANTEGVFA